MAQPKKQKMRGVFEVAAQAIGAALGTIAVKTGLAKPEPKRKRQKTPEAKRASPSKKPGRKCAARKRKVLTRKAPDPSCKSAGLRRNGSALPISLGGSGPKRAKTGPKAKKG
jgi:hypothetical protein